MWRGSVALHQCTSASTSSKTQEPFTCRVSACQRSGFLSWQCCTKKMKSEVGLGSLKPMRYIYIRLAVHLMRIKIIDCQQRKGLKCRSNFQDPPVLPFNPCPSDFFGSPSAGPVPHEEVRSATWKSRKRRELYFDWFAKGITITAIT